MAGENRVQITISANAADAKAALADVRRQLDDLGGGARDAGRNMDGLGSSLGSVRGLLAGLGVAAVASEMVQLGKAVFETGRQMEALNLSFKAITGSAAGARAELAFIRNLAGEYGQNFLSMAQSTKTFIAAAKDTELAGAGTREVIKGVSAAAAALGLDAQNVQGIFLALGQMMSKGTVQAEELRGQLGERLPGAFGLAARAMGVSTAELGKMLEQGQVLATDLIPKLAKALVDEYGESAKQAADTGTAAVNRMNTAWTDFKSSLADTGAFNAAVGSMNVLSSAIEKAALGMRRITGKMTGEEKAAFYKDVVDSLDGWSPIEPGRRAQIRLQASEAYNQQMSYNFLQMDRRSSGEYLKSREKEDLKEVTRTGASQQATLGAWTKSKDPVVSAWAKFEMSRAKSWKDVYSGKINHGAFQQEMAVHEEAFRKAQEDAAKKGSSGATAAAKADIRGSGVLQRVEDEISAVEESLGGNRLGAAIAKIEREHNRSLTQIRADLVGAKGGVDELHAAEEKLGELRDLKVKAAELKAFGDELTRSSRQAQEMAQWTGGSDLGAKWIEAYRQYVQELTDAGIQTDHADQERIARADERFQAHVDFLLEEDLRRLGEGGKLSDEYWAGEGKRLEAHLAQVKQHVTDETAFNVYAAQKRSELRRQEMEARLGYEETFLGYAQDYLAIEFKLYQDQETRKRELWRDTMASSVQFLRQIGQELQTGLSDYLTALLENDSSKREKAWRDMLNRMLSDAMRWIVDLGMLWAKQTLFIPVVASIVGVDSSGLEGLGLNVAGGQGKGGGLSLSKLGQYGGYAKDAYSLSGGGSGIISSIDKWGYNTLGIGSASSYTSAAIPMTAAQEAMAVEMGGTAGLSATHTGAAASVSGGLGSMLSAGAMGAGAGFMGGQLMRPDDPTSSYVGGAAGLAGGATAAYLGAGAWAGPVGIAAGLIASAITALATPETKSYSWGVPKASQPAVWVVDGEDVPASYGVIKTTSSGMFGSSSTKHTAIYDLASSEITAEVKAGMDAAGANLKALSKSLGQTEVEFKQTMKGVQSLMIAIPEGMEQVVYQNLTNQKAEHYLKAMGLLDQANALLRNGESYIDLINRTESAAATAGAALGVMGLNLERMSGSAERLIQGDWASKAIEAVGGADAFTGAMSRFNKWAYTGAEQAAHATEYFGGKAVEAIGEIQASGVTLTDFWGQYRARMEAGMMSPEEFGQWANAATWVEQAYNAAATSAQEQVQAEQQRLAAMQATRQELVSQAGAWEKARDSLRDFLHSMRVDQYTTLSPTANLAERQAKYYEVREKAKSGDLAANDEFRQYAADFREFAYDFHGANQDYVAIDKMIQDDTAGLISAADMQLAATNEQIARLDAQILASQQLLASSSLVNDNLARVAGAVEASGSSIVGAINSLGANASFNGGGQAAAIADANSGYQQLLASFGASADTATPDLSAIWWAPQYAHGGPVTGGIPGVDSVPAILMPGERVLSVEHNQLIERLATSGNVDTSTLERLVAQLISAVAGGNAAVAKLLARVEDNTATVASHVERQ